MPTTTQPTTDWAALDAQIDLFIAACEVTTTTRDGYANRWKRWQEFCVTLGYEPLGAPWEAYEEFWRACVTQTYFPRRRRKRDAGKPYSLSAIDGALAAIAWFHKQAGLTAAYQQPAYAALNSELRTGYARRYAPDETVSALPLRPPDVRALNRQEPPPDDAKDRLVSALFLSLEASWAWERIRLADVSTIRSWSEAGLSLEDPLDGSEVFIPCSCREAPRQGALGALPTVCGACVIGSQLAAVPDGSRLLVPQGRHPDNSRWKSALARVTGTLERLTVTPDGYLTYTGPEEPWSVLGTRLALLESERGGLAFRSAQARMSISWPIALRSDDEPSRMQRRHVSIRSDGSLVVELPKAKRDQAAHGAQFHIPGEPRLTNALGRVVQWLAIIDAFTHMGPDGPLFPAFGPSDGPRRPRSKSSRQFDFAAIQRAAGLSGFTLHSTRTGFATTGIEQGYTESDLQEAMRLTQPRDLIRYARAAHTNAGAPAEQLIRRLMEAE